MVVSVADRAVMTGGYRSWVPVIVAAASRPLAAPPVSR